MGIHSSAELIYGIPVTAYEEATEANWYDPPASRFWDDSEDAEDWRDLPSPLKIDGYGHYEECDEQAAILTTSEIPSFRGDCWDAKKILASQLIVDYDVQERANAALRKHDLPGDFHTDAAWYLVASVG